MPLIRHPGRFHHLRWESTLEKFHRWGSQCQLMGFIGSTWHEAALDRDAWAHAIREFVQLVSY
eukprot:5845818-Amphidinium_carterae.1